MINSIGMKDLHFAKSNTGAVAQEPHGHLKVKTPSEGVSVLGQYEHRYKKYCGSGCYMPRVSAEIAKKENDTL